MTPSADSIAVWWDAKNVYGHVAFVEAQTKTDFLVNEGNATTDKSFADTYDPVNPECDKSGPHSWGGGYDGQVESFTTSSNGELERAAS